MKFKPFARQGRQVVLDDYAIEYIMPSLKPDRAWHVLCFIAYKTEGYGKPEDDISYTQIMAGTGIKHPKTLAKCLNSLESHKYIICVNRDIKEQWDTNRYRINVDYEVDLEIPSTSQNEATLASQNEAETPLASQNEATLASQNEDTCSSSHVVVDKDSFEHIYPKIWVPTFGSMKEGEAQIFGDYFDDPECPNAWIREAVAQTISLEPPPVNPFRYFKRTINTIISEGGPNGARKGKTNATHSKRHRDNDRKLADERAALENEIRELEQQDESS